MQNNKTIPVEQGWFSIIRENIIYYMCLIFYARNRGKKMKKEKVDVIIPTYHPGNEFEEILERLKKQSLQIHKLLIINTEEIFWNKEWEKRYPFLEVHHIKKEEFDHGGTRKKAAQLSEADILVFMTQDALPKNARLVESLVNALETNDMSGAAYARQLPRKDCSYIERFTRSFNYPEKSAGKRKQDLPVYGIKTFFCSNVCAAYKKKVYEKMGGFPERAIFNEDMILAGKMIQEGYEILYAAEAEVIHSHNYSSIQQFHRNFDLGVSQADHPEIFGGIPSEKEGVRLVKKTLMYLLKNGRIWLIPSFVMQCGCKFLGYRIGKSYQKLPLRVIQWCTMNKTYWI